MAKFKGQDTAGESVNPDGDLDKPASDKTENMKRYTIPGKLTGGKMSHEKLNDKMSRDFDCP